MKKTLVALLVAGVATSAQAKVELFNQDGTVATVKGNVNSFLYTSDDSNDAKVDPVITVSAKAQFDFSHQVSDNLKVGGTFEIQNKHELDGSGSNDAEFDDVAAYISGDFGKIGFGEIGDVENSDNGVNKEDIANELGGNLLPTLSDSAGNGVSYSKKFGDFKVIADAYTEEEEYKDNSYGLGFDYATDLFSVGAMYQVKGAVGQYTVQERDNTGQLVDVIKGNDKERTVLGVSGELSLDSLTLAATVGAAEQGSYEALHYGASASFAIDAAKVYGTYNVTDVDGASDTANHLVLGASYDVSSLFTVFAETAASDNGSYDKNQFLVGGYFNF